MFQIEPDLLTLLSYMVYMAASGEGSSCFANRSLTFHGDGSTSLQGTTRWLEEAYEANRDFCKEDSEKNEVEEFGNFLMWQAADQLLFDEREALMMYSVGRASLLPDFKRKMNRCGFMIKDQFPRAVKEYLEIRADLFEG